MVSGAFVKYRWWLLVFVAMQSFSLAMRFHVPGTEVDQKPEDQPSAKVGPMQLREVLAGPSGLRKCAELIKTCVVNADLHLYLRTSLADLIHDSSFIVIGTITNQRSDYDENSDNIYTYYTIKPEQVIKGATSSNIIFLVRGGKFEFPNGTTAEQATTVWKQLKDDQKYTFFLTKSKSTGYFLLTNEREAIFRLSSPSGAVEVLASYSNDRASKRIIDDVKGLSPAALAAKVQTVLLQGNTAPQR